MNKASAELAECRLDRSKARDPVCRISSPHRKREIRRLQLVLREDYRHVPQQRVKDTSGRGAPLRKRLHNASRRATRLDSLRLKLIARLWGQSWLAAWKEVPKKHAWIVGRKVWSIKACTSIVVIQ